MPAVVNSLSPSASELPAHNPPQPPFHNNLPHFDHSVFTRCRRALEYVWARLEIAWAKLQDIWNTTRRKFTLSTWLAISISVIVGGLGVRYAYVQVVLSYEGLMLAKWTARKDFWELCQEQKLSNNATSAECELVLRTHFLDPPYVDLGRRSWKQPDRSTVIYEGPDIVLAQNDNARLTHGVLLSALAAVLLMRNYRRMRRLLNTALRGSALGDNRTMDRCQGSYHAEDASDTIALSQMSTGTEMAPAETLRSRGMKKQLIIHQGGKIKDVIPIRSERLYDLNYYQTQNGCAAGAGIYIDAAVPKIAEIIRSSRGLKELPVIHQSGKAAGAGSVKDVVYHLKAGAYWDARGLPLSARYP